MDVEKILAITFSGMRPEEAPAAKKLLTACRLPREDLTEDMLRNFLVARKGERLIGVIGLEICGPDALLRSLAVDEAFRRQGIAARLTEFIARYATGLGIKDIYLLTTTAEAFFAAHGYRSIDRSLVPESILAAREFSELCPATAVCMYRKVVTP